MGLKTMQDQWPNPCSSCLYSWESNGVGIGNYAIPDAKEMNMNFYDPVPNNHFITGYL